MKYVIRQPTHVQLSILTGLYKLCGWKLSSTHNDGCCTLTGIYNINVWIHVNRLMLTSNSVTIEPLQSCNHELWRFTRIYKIIPNNSLSPFKTESTGIAQLVINVLYTILHTDFSFNDNRMHAIKQVFPNAALSLAKIPACLTCQNFEPIVFFYWS